MTKKFFKLLASFNEEDIEIAKHLLSTFNNEELLKLFTFAHFILRSSSEQDLRLQSALNVNISSIYSNIYSPDMGFLNQLTILIESKLVKILEDVK